MVSERVQRASGQPVRRRIPPRARAPTDLRTGYSEENFLSFHQGKNAGISEEAFIVNRGARFSRKLCTPS